MIVKSKSNSRISSAWSDKVKIFQERWELLYLFLSYSDGAVSPLHPVLLQLVAVEGGRMVYGCVHRSTSTLPDSDSRNVSNLNTEHVYITLRFYRDIFFPRKKARFTLMAILWKNMGGRREFFVWTLQQFFHLWGLTIIKQYFIPNTHNLLKNMYYPFLIRKPY